MRAAIVGIAGSTLLRDEASMLRALQPAGVILFGRNVVDPVQLRILCDALRDELPEGAVVAVDQEGGRVARLRPPHWRSHPAAATVGALFQRREADGLRAAFLTGALIGAECAAGGLDCVCAPVLDVRFEGASDVVGDRSFGSDPVVVAALGGAVASGLMRAGVLPVGKHAPGHGRASVDSHHALPVVPAEANLGVDASAFILCSTVPWMMTAHIRYEGIDPARPGTLSPVVIAEVIRGRIRFEGVLVSDDLAMRALEGEPGELAAAAVAAGCDVALHCTGVLAESEAVLRAVPPVSDRGLARMADGRAAVQRRRAPLDVAAMAAEREALLAC